MPHSFPPRAIAMAALFALARPAPAQTHRITVHPNQRVASLEMTTAEYASWKSNDDFNDSKKRTALVQDLYKSFRDEFDFIFLVLNQSEPPANFEYYGELISVSNATQGLGSRLFDETKAYGSGGRLKSVMALADYGALAGGPSLHELMHNWANFGIKVGGFEPAQGGGGTPYPDYRPHWGFTGGNTAGQLGGFKQSTLKTNVDGNAKKYQADEFGQFANGGNGVPYSELELYLAGFIPAAQVTPFDVFRDITAYDYEKNTWEANTKVRYDSTRILSELGARSPGVAAAQKEFRLLVVILNDGPLADSTWARMDKDSERFGRPSDDGTFLYNFWEATGGRAKIETGKLAQALIPAQVIAGPRRGRLEAFPGAGFDVAGRWRAQEQNPLSVVLSIRIP